MKFVTAMVLMIAAGAMAQSGGPTGHWEGTIQAPNGGLTIQIDLARGDKGGWIGTVSIPQQGVTGFPLENIAVTGKSVAFAMKGVPGPPRFQGTVSADNTAISGNFTQGGAPMAFKVVRTGEAKITAPAKSTPISKEIEGLWEGAVKVNGASLRLIMRLLRGEDGTGGGSITSVDQGGVAIDIGTVTQQGSNLKVELPSVRGEFTGQIAKDFKSISGTWSQGAGELPMTFTRPHTNAKLQ